MSAIKNNDKIYSKTIHLSIPGFEGCDVLSEFRLTNLKTKINLIHMYLKIINSC